MSFKSWSKSRERVAV